MVTTKLSSKGQVILPKSVRDSHRWKSGTVLAVEDIDGGVVLRPVKPFQSTRIEDVIGCSGYRGPRKSLGDMQRAIASGARGQK